MLVAARGFSILRKALATAPLAGNRPGLFIFPTVSLAQQAGAGQQRVYGARESPYVAGIHGHQEQVRPSYRFFQFGINLHAGVQGEAG